MATSDPDPDRGPEPDHRPDRDGGDSASAGHAGLPGEALAWCSIRGRNGRSVVTNSYNDRPQGALFVAVRDVDATPLGHWLAPAWADEADHEDVMAQLWTSATDGQTVHDTGYGVELSWPLARGELRACPSGTYVRFNDATGNELDGGSAYWISDEWLEDPELVMAAILGAARTLSDREPNPRQ